MSNLQDYLAGARFDLLLVGSLIKTAQPFHDAMQLQRARPLQSVGLLIGPEGDLTQDETDVACRAGAIPVNFGSNVFRVETAAIYGLSVLMYELAG